MNDFSPNMNANIMKNIKKSHNYQKY